MIVNLITFASFLHKQASIRVSHEVVLSELEKHFTVNLVDYQDAEQLGPDDFKLVFMATGGEEQLVVQYFETLSEPVVILADGIQNSLAAA